MITKYVTAIIALLILLFVIELIREEKLMFKYALGWIVISLLAIFFTIFDKILFKLSEFFGFELTSNFIFFSLLTIFVFITLFITIFLCQQNNHNDKIAQKLGILEFEIDQLKKEKDKEQS